MQAILPHIGIFGRCNSGKSTLFNALLGQEISIVSEISGTTTDVVRRNIEWPQLGACVLIDTAGIDDESPLGKKRIEQTTRVATEVDLGIIIATGEDTAIEESFSKQLKKCIWIGKKGIENDLKSIYNAVAEALLGEEEIDFTKGLTDCGERVLLVMPQDKSAPKGRLILPQVQTIRNLLDKHCIVTCCTPKELTEALNLKPNLIICDSQVLKEVVSVTTEDMKITTFSILMATEKGDLNLFKKGVEKLSMLSENSSVLIVEACTHVPKTEDIGTVKIPNLLRKRFGNLKITNVRGNDFPVDLSSYDLVIHCGACMQTRQAMLARQKQAVAQNVPLTNYGLAIAYLQNIKLNI